MMRLVKDTGSPKSTEDPVRMPVKIDDPKPAPKPRSATRWNPAWADSCWSLAFWYSKPEFTVTLGILAVIIDLMACQIFLQDLPIVGIVIAIVAVVIPIIALTAGKKRYGH